MSTAGPTAPGPTAKYGHAFSADDWQGPAMRKGDWAAHGRLEDVTAPGDVVLIWSGNPHQVTLHGSTPGGRPSSHDFVRESGMIDVMPAGTRLSEIRWQGGSATCVSLCFGDDCLRELFGDRVPRLDPATGARFGFRNPHVFALAERLHQQTASGQPMGAAYVQGLSLTLASYVLASPGMAGRSPREASVTPPLNVEAIAAHVEDNLGRNLGLVELARVAGYSPDHFTRLFKRAFLLSPYQYILRRRIARAKALLRDPRHSIVDVALTAGFSSQAHLNAMFKRTMGVTPGRYRKG